MHTDSVETKPFDDTGYVFHLLFGFYKDNGLCSGVMDVSDLLEKVVKSGKNFLCETMQIINRNKIRLDQNNQIFLEDSFVIS